MAVKPNFFRAVGVALLLWRAWEYFKGQTRLLDQWDWSLRGIRVISIAKNFLEIEIQLDLENVSNVNATVTGIDVDVYLENKNIGRAISNDLFYFQPYGTSPITLRFRSSLSNLLMVVRNLMSRGLAIPVRIEGSMKAETVRGVFVPVPISYATTVKELVI